MKISINWLKDYLDTDHTPEEISEILTNLGLEVEKISDFESVSYTHLTLPTTERV